VNAPASTREAVTEAAPFLKLACATLDAAARDDRLKARALTTEARAAYVELRDRGILPDPLQRALNIVLGYASDAAGEVSA
jgi:hypothetical protein